MCGILAIVDSKVVALALVALLLLVCVVYQRSGACAAALAVALAALAFLACAGAHFLYMRLYAGRDWRAKGDGLPYETTACPPNENGERRTHYLVYVDEDELKAIIRELDILLHDGNLPQTRHRDAAGQNLINAVFGLLYVLKTYDERKRQTTHLCELFFPLKIRVPQMDIRNWRRRERELPHIE